jgi:NADH:ubiquinone oxidoreductase subunit E
VHQARIFLKAARKEHFMAMNGKGKAGETDDAEGNTSIAPNATIPETQLKRRDTLLSALHEIQNRTPQKTWITKEELAEIAQSYGIPLAELDGIVSFYTMFSRERRGRHVIRLCDSLSCRICGSLDIYRHLRKKLGIPRGMTTVDGAFSLEIVNCLGACSTSPNIMIDDHLISGLSLAEIDAMLDRLAKEEV